MEIFQVVFERIGFNIDKALDENNNEIDIYNYRATIKESFLFNGFAKVSINSVVKKRFMDEIFKFTYNSLKEKYYLFMFGIFNLNLKIRDLEITFYVSLEDTEISVYDYLYLSLRDIENIIDLSEKIESLFSKKDDLIQAQKELVTLKNKLTYDGNPTEINTLKSIIAGLLCIIDPSRPIDRRYLTKSGKLSKNKLANDVEKCLKTLSPEEIKKVSNRTIRNHFSKITKSKAN